MNLNSNSNSKRRDYGLEMYLLELLQRGVLESPIHELWFLVLFHFCCVFSRKDFEFQFLTEYGKNEPYYSAGFERD